MSVRKLLVQCPWVKPKHSKQPEINLMQEAEPISTPKQSHQDINEMPAKVDRTSLKKVGYVCKIAHPEIYNLKDIIDELEATQTLPPPQLDTGLMIDKEEY